MNIYILIGTTIEEVEALAVKQSMAVIGYDPDHPEASIHEFTGIRSLCFDPEMGQRIGQLNSAEDGFAAFARNA